MTAAEIVDALRMIAAPTALMAAVEYELEDLGLITTDHRPYATLTPAGRALLSTPQPLSIGDRVRADRYFGETGHANLATVEQIRENDVVIRFDEAGIHDNYDISYHRAPMTVGRYPADLLPA